MRKCVNCGERHVGKPNENGFAKCPDCGCTNIVPRPEDYAAAHKVRQLLESGKLRPYVSNAPAVTSGVEK
jgi:predicted  nucleic acid-binding Zn-ribbon protein